MFNPHKLREPRLTGVKRRTPGPVRALGRAAQTLGLQLLAGLPRRTTSASDAMLITSSARSGSTWLFELLASDPHVIPVLEPFHPRFNPLFQPYSDRIGHLEPPTTPDDARRLAQLIQEVYAGRQLNRWSATVLPRHRLLTGSRILVKEVFINRALWWMKGVQSVPTVLLVRHPCAVVESMLRAPMEWHEWPQEGIASALTLTLAQLDEELPVGGVPTDQVGLLAALWAVETRAAITALRGERESWMVFYEDLVHDPVGMAHAVGCRLGLYALRFDADRPSRSTRAPSPFDSKGALGNWRSRLSGEAVAAIVDTAHAFGVRAYTDRLEPERTEIDGMAMIGP